VISASTSINTTRAAGDVLGGLQQWAHHNRLKAQRVSPTQVDIRRGSNAALRIKGAIFTKPEQFPVVAAISATSNEWATTVHINVLDDLGPAVRTGMKKKMQAAVDSFLASIVSHLKEFDAS